MAYKVFPYDIMIIINDYLNEDDEYWYNYFLERVEEDIKVNYDDEIGCNACGSYTRWWFDAYDCYDLCIICGQDEIKKYRERKLYYFG